MLTLAWPWTLTVCLTAVEHLSSAEENSLPTVMVLPFWVGG